MLEVGITNMPERTSLDWMKEVKPLLEVGLVVSIVFPTEKEAFNKRQMLHQKFYKIKLGEVITKVQGSTLFIQRKK
jgi:hypothetical protein